MGAQNPLVEVINNFRYTGTGLHPAPTINGSMSGYFFRTFLTFLNFGLGNHFFGFYESFRSVSVYELSYMNRILNLLNTQSISLQDLSHDLRIFNSLLNINIRDNQNVHPYFLHVSGNFYVYVDNGNLHQFNHITPVNSR